MSYKIKIKDLKKAIYEAAMARKSEYENLSFVNKIFKEDKYHIEDIKKIIKENKDNGKTLHKYLLNECGCSSKYDKVRNYMPYDSEEDVMLYDLEEDFDFDEEDYAHGETPYDQSIYPSAEFPYEVEFDDDDVNNFPGMDDEKIFEDSSYDSSKKIDLAVYAPEEDMTYSYNYFKKNILKDPNFAKEDDEPMYVAYHSDRSGENVFTLHGKKYQYVNGLYPSGKNATADDYVPQYWVAEQMFEGSKKIKKAHMKGMNEQQVISEIKKMEEQGYSMTAFNSEQEMNEYLSGSKKNINPFDASNWIGYKKKVNELDSNLPPDFNQGAYDYAGYGDEEE